MLGYTVHYVLAKLAPHLKPGEIDYCAPSLVRTLMEDVFGEAAEKKEVEAIATSMKEARTCKSFASFELLASVISFVPGVNMLVPPVHKAVLDAPGGADSIKNMSNGRELLRRATAGLSANRYGTDVLYLANHLGSPMVLAYLDALSIFVVAMFTSGIGSPPSK